MLRFEWDKQKNKQNRAKHKVWFEEAQSVFEDSQARVFYDDDHSDREDRFVILGLSSAPRLLVVVHGHSAADSIVRIISARKATRKESKTYEEGI